MHQRFKKKNLAQVVLLVHCLTMMPQPSGLASPGMLWGRHLHCRINLNSCGCPPPLGMYVWPCNATPWRQAGRSCEDALCVCGADGQTNRGAHVPHRGQADTCTGMQRSLLWPLVCGLSLRSSLLTGSSNTSAALCAVTCTMALVELLWWSVFRA